MVYLNVTGPETWYCEYMEIEHLIGFNATALAAPAGADHFFGVITCTWEDSGILYVAVRDLDDTDERTFRLDEIKVSG